MCLIAFALDCHPVYRLALVANRDEFLDRPTAPARFWEDAPQILAGRDLRSGGTWLGVTRDGLFAAVTNYRDPAHRVENPISRGKLTTDFLLERPHPERYLERLERIGDRCDGFNIIFGDTTGLYYYSNRGGVHGRISPGIHALSNHLLDTPWPKVAVARNWLEELVSRENFVPEELLSAMYAVEAFPDDELPETGVGQEWERMLSPIFIRERGYGTRSTTLLLVDRENAVTFVEESHYPPGRAEFRFAIG
jgi:uncharacterized protein with NRDE domain